MSTFALSRVVSDFAKAKIVFALALVGVLFAIHPVVRDLGDAGYTFFGSVLQFRVIYYAMLSLLGCVIYFYAVDFITDNPLGMAHRIGNWFYAMALLFPPLFALVATAIKVAEGVVWISDSPMAGEVSKVAITTIAVCFCLLFAYVASRGMNRRDREDTVDRLAFRSKGHLNRAEELMEAGHHDLVALEAFRCIESVLQRALLDGNIAVSSSRANQLIPVAARAGIIPESLVGVFHELRIARNRAVHSRDQFTVDDATWFLDTTRKMIGSVRAPQPLDDPAQSTPSSEPLPQS